MSVIKHTELFDFPAYEAGIKEVKDSTNAFGVTAEQMLKRLTAQQKQLTASLKEYAGILKNFNIVTNGAASGLQKYNKEIDDTVKSMGNLKQVETALVGTMDAAKLSADQLAQEFKQLKKELSAMSPTSADYAKRTAEINARIKEIVPGLQAYSQALKNTTQSVKNAEGSYKAMQTQLTALRNRLKEMPNAFNPYTGALNKSNREAVTLQKEINRLDTVLKKADNQMGIYSRNVGNYSSALSGLANGFKQLVGLTSIVETGRAIFEINREFDQLNQGLKNVSGTAEEFALNQRFLTTSAQNYGLEIIGLTKGFKNFYASATQAGLTATQTRQIFDRVAKSAANLKLSQEDVNGVLLAFGQIAAKGKVQAEELRGQIGERVPGAYAIAARAIGKTGHELNKLLETGDLVSTDFLPKFARELEKSFGKQDYVESLTGSVNRLFNVIKTGVQSERFTNFLRVSLDYITDLIASTQEYVQGVGDYFEKIQDPKAANLKRKSEAAKKETEGLNDYLEELRRKFNDNDTAGMAKALLKQKALVEKAEKERNDIVKRYGNNRSTTIVAQAESDYQFQKKLLDAFREDFNTVTNANPPKQKTDAQLKAEQEKAEQLRRQRQADAEREVRDREAVLKRAAELDIAYQELALSEKEISEEEFQKRKLAIIKDYTKQSILVERTLGAQADADRIDQFARTAVEAQTAYNIFITKSNEERKAKEKKDLEEAIKDRKKSLEEIGKDKKAALDKQYQDEIDAENLAFALFADGRDTNYQEEVKHLEKLKAIKTKYLIETDKEEQALERLKADRRRQLEEQTQELIFDAITAGSNILEENSRARYEERIGQLEKEKQKEIDAAGNNAAAKEAIEKRYAIRIAQEKRKAAQAEKQFALFNVGISTAEAVAKTFSVWGWPAGIPFAALAVAQGAIQAAVIASKPIPAFKKGTKSAPSGMAIVGEEGSELIERNGRMFVTPNKASFVKLVGGEKIHTHKETLKIFERAESNAAVARMLKGDIASVAAAANIRHEKEAQMISVMAQSGRINQAEIQQAFREAVKNIPVHTTVFDERGMRKVVQERNQRITYLNSRELGNR